MRGILVKHFSTQQETTLKDQFFVHVSVDADNPAMRQVRRGKVMGAVGPAHWLLKFQGRGYTHNSVVPVEQLAAFSFFDTAQEQNAYLMDNFPPPPPTPEAAGVSSVGRTTAAAVNGGGDLGPALSMEP